MNVDLLGRLEQVGLALPTKRLPNEPGIQWTLIPDNLPEKLDYLMPFYQAVQLIVDEIAGFNSFFEEEWHYHRHLLRAVSVVLERSQLSNWQQLGVLMDCLCSSDVKVDSILDTWCPAFRELNNSAYDELSLPNTKDKLITLEQVATYILAGLALELNLFSYTPIEP